MQGKNTSDIKLNVPTCQGLEKCFGLGLSTSRSRSRLELEAKRLGLGPQRLVYIPGIAR